jgi:hypothetical protein
MSPQVGSSPSLDLKLFVVEMLALARVNLEQSDELLPVVFAMDAKGSLQVIGVSFHRDGKYKAYRAVSSYLRQIGAVAAVLINDSWMVKLPPGTSEEEACRVPPSQHPNRVECLNCFLVTPDGKVGHSMTQPYRRNGGTINWEAVEVLPEGSKVDQNLLPAWGPTVETWLQQ